MDLQKVRKRPFPDALFYTSLRDLPTFPAEGSYSKQLKIRFGDRGPKHALEKVLTNEATSVGHGSQNKLRHGMNLCDLDDLFQSQACAQMTAVCADVQCTSDIQL